MHWTAAPAVPLVRLSTAPTATSRPARSSTVDLQVHGVRAEHRLVCGHCPSGSRCTNGSSAYAFTYAACTSSAVTPGQRGGAGGEDAARHRDQHRREADTVTGAVGDGRPRFCSISGVCRCAAADAVRLAVPITSLPSRFGLGALPAPLVPDAATTTTSGSTRPAATAGASERRDGRVAAGDRDPGGAAQRVALAGSSGSP